MPDKAEPDAPKLRATYDQLCLSYHAIDDFRAKLLGFLPLVTGGGLVLLTGRPEKFAKEFFLPVGIFGLAVTAALFSYEIFGIRKCHDLIILGKQLEDLLNHPGQFTVRRKTVGRAINEPFAAGIIYPAVMAAWVYLALYYKARTLGIVISIAIFLLGFILTFRYDRYLGRHPNEPPPWWVTLPP
jgi:multisubunit Na+/H+ antiporter MnhF subunit